MGSNLVICKCKCGFDSHRLVKGLGKTAARFDSGASLLNYKLMYWRRLFPYDKDTDKSYGHILAPAKTQNKSK